MHVLAMLEIKKAYLSYGKQAFLLF